MKDMHGAPSGPQLYLLSEEGYRELKNIQTMLRLMAEIAYTEEDDANGKRSHCIWRMNVTQQKLAPTPTQGIQQRYQPTKIVSCKWLRIVLSENSGARRVERRVEIYKIASLCVLKNYRFKIAMVQRCTSDNRRGTN
jgi:hypothetical protein